jgi:transcriptional regulator GlxA family with amidase domain
VQDVVKLLAENLQYPWQLEELADSMLLGSRQLERRCKESLGCGPMQYLRLLRLEAAAELLRTTHEQINQIAQQVGFPDARYFRRSFKEYFGISPGEYRQQQAQHVVFSPQMSEISPLSTDESSLT